MDEYEGCEGCKLRSIKYYSCSFTDLFVCPCTDCIVKPMCSVRDGCDKSDKWRDVIFDYIQNCDVDDLVKREEKFPKKILNK